MNSPFSNNLRLGDVVYSTERQIRGTVAKNVRSHSRTVVVRFQGVERPQRLDVMTLRFCPDKFLGAPEDTAPVDGTPPSEADRESSKVLTPLDVLKAERDRNQHAMDALNAQFKALRELNDRLDKAIAALSPVPQASGRPVDR